MWRMTFPFPAKPKARPRGGRSWYMPRPYMEWREQVVEAIKAEDLKGLTGRVKVFMRFTRDDFYVEILPSEKGRYGNADLDNLVGGVLDALQDAQAIENDRDVVILVGQFADEQPQKQ